MLLVADVYSFNCLLQLISISSLSIRIELISRRGWASLPTLTGQRSCGKFLGSLIQVGRKLSLPNLYKMPLTIASTSSVICGLFSYVVFSVSFSFNQVTDNLIRKWSPRMWT